MKERSARSTVLAILVLGCATVMAFHVLAVVVRSVLRPEAGALFDFLTMLDASQERNLAAWWTASLLALAAAFAGFLGQLARRAGSPRREIGSWHVFAAIFAVLSLDEIVSLHERGRLLTASVLDAGSPLAQLGWTIPASAVLVVSVGVLLPVLLALPRRAGATIVAGLAISVAGALGLELLNVALFDAGAELRWRYIVMAIEEAAEMGGIVVVLAGMSTAVSHVCIDGWVTLEYRGRSRSEHPT